MSAFSKYTHVEPIHRIFKLNYIYKCNTANDSFLNSLLLYTFTGDYK